MTEKSGNDAAGRGWGFKRGASPGGRRREDSSPGERSRGPGTGDGDWCRSWRPSMEWSMGLRRDGGRAVLEG